MLPTTITARKTRPAGRRLVRKNMYMDQAKLDIAKKHFGVATETEAIDKALDLATFRDEVISGLEAVAKLGPLKDVYRRR